MAVILSSNSMTGTSFSLPASFKFNSKHSLNSIQSQSIVVSAYGKSAYPPPPSPPPLAMASSSTLYEVLGIQATATCHEIKTAYRKLARICHPDVVAMNQKDNSAVEFMKIHAAYTILSDPDKRANYDRGLIFRSRSYGLSATVATSSRPTSPLSGYTCRRTWETDQCW
ncbi:hypothetical protein Nepgr_015379 [Nepenthes gracilis]|uniref:J domain-containing protein n=1 Tax=Nepenthes gracilis TaxID=150966 RepID=A0AAD3SLL0_NEPGR|nr:hypothetical protein Nepgr_015379 [Nepenthes gracilis]